MSARADTYYPGVCMQRTMLLLRDARLPHPVVVDLYKLTSAQPHTYDYPVHFRGQLIATNAKYAADTMKLVPLGTNYGYHQNGIQVWKVAANGAVTNGNV